MEQKKPTSQPQASTGNPPKPQSPGQPAPKASPAPQTPRPAPKKEHEPKKK